MVEIINVKISSLSLLDKNPRTISKQQMDKLCKSIESDPNFLYNRPILVHDSEGKLIVYAGNQRVRAARLLKWKEIPCIIEKDLPEDLIKQRIIKDNAHYGEFDFDELANEYDIEMLLDAGLESKDFGFDKEIETIDSDEEKSEEKKTKHECPACGYAF